MPEQFEHDISASLAAAKEKLGSKGLFGGGRIDNFRIGWAMYIWGRRKVHYWNRFSLAVVKSRCGIIKPALWTTPSGEMHSTLYGGGDFGRCKRCQ